MGTARLLTWRTEYIATIQKYKAENRNIVFLDGTWFDTHDGAHPYCRRGQRDS
jgi:hypothetical protein